MDKDTSGEYLISARDTYSVHKINGTAGSTIWRLDDKNSSFALGVSATFCFQHHARFHPELKGPEDGDDIEIISLHDNAAHRTEDGRGSEVHTAPTSSGKMIKLNATAWTAELVQGFYPPDMLLSKSQESTQLLPNGSVVVNWGFEGALTEEDSAGNVLFQTHCTWTLGISDWVSRITAVSGITGWVCRMRIPPSSRWRRMTRGLPSKFLGMEMRRRRSGGSMP